MGKKRLYHDKQPRQRLKLPRCHWTKKDNHYKPKRPFATEDDAWEYLKQKPWLLARKYTCYRCDECGFWHIGFVNNFDGAKTRG